jgi:hypothetical protein
MAMTVDEPFLSPAAVGDRLGVKTDIVLAWIAAGQLSAVNVASPDSTRPRWKISPEDLDRFLATRRNGPAPVPRPRRRRQPPDVIEFFR